MQVVDLMQCEQLIFIILNRLAKLRNRFRVFGDARLILGSSHSFGKYLPFLGKALITGKAQTCFLFGLQKKASLAAISVVVQFN